MRSILLSFVILMLGVGKAFAAQSLIVNIDNPSFRKVVVATPQFSKDGASGGLADRFQLDGSREFNELLKFTGFFNIVSEKAYADYMGKMIGERKSKDGSSWLNKMVKLNGDEAVQWRSLGVESLTLASAQSEGSQIVLVMKTFDVNRNKQILAKEFKRVSNMKTTLRRYADFLLKHILVSLVSFLVVWPLLGDVLRVLPSRFLFLTMMVAI